MLKYIFMLLPREAQTGITHSIMFPDKSTVFTNPAEVLRAEEFGRNDGLIVISTLPQFVEDLTGSGLVPGARFMRMHDQPDQLRPAGLPAVRMLGEVELGNEDESDLAPAILLVKKLGDIAQISQVSFSHEQPGKLRTLLDLPQHHPERHFTRAYNEIARVCILGASALHYMFNGNGSKPAKDNYRNRPLRRHAVRTMF